MEQEKKLSPQEQAAQGNTAQEDGQELGGEELNKAAGGYTTGRSSQPKYRVGDIIVYGYTWSPGTLKRAVIREVERSPIDDRVGYWVTKCDNSGTVYIFEDIIVDWL